LKNILSVDVEEVFHAEYVRGMSSREDEFRTEFAIPKILDFFDECNVKATFFVLGELAERYSSLIREIVSRGHEVGFHSYDHKPLWEKNQSQLEKEIEQFNELLIPIVGRKCSGFRAPSFSLNRETKWAVEVLDKMEMVYDSSVFPAWTPLYGVSNAPMKPYKLSKADLTSEDIEGRLWEFPLAVYSLLKVRIPSAGGFYLRLMPSLLRRAIKKINSSQVPAVIFVHSWELDPETPKLKLNPFKSFVTYHNIEKTWKLVKELLIDFDFTSFADFMKGSGMI
jgi:polysaccharide deacetylase family protein (PEP-CTERM system associated)